MPAHHPRHTRSAKTRALHARDAGLRRVSILTRVAVVGSVAAAGAFSAVAAWAQPGRAKSVTSNGALGTTPTRPVGVPATNGAPSGTQATVPATTPQTVAPTDGGYTGGYAGGGENLSPPTTVPDPGYSYSGPAVVSGAS